MLRRIPARLFQEWVVYGKLEPFEPERLEQVITRIVQTLLNIHRRRGQTAYSLEQVMPRFGDAGIRRKKHWKELFRMAEQITKDWNADWKQRN